MAVPSEAAFARLEEQVRQLTMNGVRLEGQMTHLVELADRQERRSEQMAQKISSMEMQAEQLRGGWKALGFIVAAAAALGGALMAVYKILWLRVV